MKTVGSLYEKGGIKSLPTIRMWGLLFMWVVILSEKDQIKIG